MATPASVAIVLALALFLLGCYRSDEDTSGRSQEHQGPKTAKVSAEKFGLLVNDPRASQGYTLILPMMSGKTYLVDMQGKVVRMWESDCYPTLSAYLLENGHLLRTGNV